MAPRRERIRRVLPRSGGPAGLGRSEQPMQPPRRLGGVVVDFGSLELPCDLRQALADAFWHHYGPRRTHTAVNAWFRVRVFARFVLETRAARSLADLNTELLARYIEWLSRQRGANDTFWSKRTRSVTYGTLRKLLHWLARCRPGLFSPIEYPCNPFPWRNRDGPRRPKVAAAEVRALLRACERDIERLRAERRRADEERAAARQNCSDPLASRGALLACIAERFAGLVPRASVLLSRGNYRCYLAVSKYGRKQIETCLYPGIDTILPYYLAVLIHTAGNAHAIADLGFDCLQSVPLLEDRELLVWSKPRAAALQRRSFRSKGSFEPPVLVRELIEWTQRLRPHAKISEREKLFLLKTTSGVRALSDIVLVQPLRDFEKRHGLTHIAPASIRPSVLTALYRSSGDLVQVKVVANHARLSTTVGYVEAPEVEAQNRARIATLQHAFVGHIEGAARAADADDGGATSKTAAVSMGGSSGIPPGTAVSMFGFDCLDPLSGIAPGTRAGEVCSNFLACFTCPNAVIPRDARTVARLLQARDHLKAAAAYLHPARWEAIYVPPLKILEEDILTRFAARELAQAQKLIPKLASLPPLR